MTLQPANTAIGTMGEHSLHAAIKQWYARPGDQLEVCVDGFLVDIVRDGLLIEIQTRSFGALKSKLAALLENHTVRLVHPIAIEKWIVQMSPDGLQQLARRKSPKHGNPIQVFEELVSIPELALNPGLSIELLLIREEEVRRKDGLRHWRRKGWGVFDRRLIDVAKRMTLDTPSDFAAMLPADIPQPFSTQDLSDSLARPRREVQQMAYCLRKMGVIHITGKGHGDGPCYGSTGANSAGTL
ncbi:MAG: hypothetical protein HQ592_11910, partial [Planctomycetes bacterium]|nr:hypothetical protein [Planctomycetota bacterium]